MRPIGAVPQRLYTTSRFTHVSKSDFPFWLAKNTHLAAPSHPPKSRRTVQDGYFFLSKEGGNIFSA